MALLNSVIQLPKTGTLPQSAYE